MRDERFPITGMGKETCDWTYVGDIVDGLLRAGTMKEAEGQAFKLASGSETRVIDVARWINEETGNTAGVRYSERRRWDTKERLLASVDKAEVILGYDPRTEFREGLRRTVEWFRAQRSEIQATARF